MENVYIIYWSQTGNTQAMAEAMAEGVREAGKEPVLWTVEQADLSVLKKEKGFAIGCPAMGAEVLEEEEMEPFVTMIEDFVSGKNIAIFGSYGWGDGQWMRDWEERMNQAGASLLQNAGLMCQEAPDAAAVEECKAMGKQLASL